MELPLFPYELVGFPGVPVPLRFFEPRYKQMCEDVVGATDRFGIVLAAPGSRFEAEVPVEVGTVARIVDHVRLPDGQWLVHAVGESRFRLTRLGPRRPYLTAEVNEVEEKAGDDLRAFALRDALLGKLRRLFALRTELGGPSLPVDVELDDEPGPASYELAALMGLDLATQQRLLEIEADDDRLAAEVLLMDEALAGVEHRLTRGGGFGGLK